MTTSISIQSPPLTAYPDADPARRIDAAARGQLIEIPPGEYDWIHLHIERGRAMHGELEDTMWLHYRDGVDPEWLRITAGTHTCRIPVPRHATLVACRLPNRAGLWVRGLTLIAAASAGAAPSTPAQETISND